MASAEPRRYVPGVNSTDESLPAATGYGVRARDDLSAADLAEPLELRCRRSYVVGNLVGAAVGCAAGWYFTSALVAAGAWPSLLGALRVAVYALVGWVVGAASMVTALTFAVAPMGRVDRGRLYWRHAFRRRELAFDAAELRWRPGAAYVGRYLLTSRGGEERKLPLALLRRRDQRRLFAWMDRNVPPGVPPPAPSGVSRAR